MHPRAPLSSPLPTLLWTVYCWGGGEPKQQVYFFWNLTSAVCAFSLCSFWHVVMVSLSLLWPFNHHQQYFCFMAILRRQMNKSLSSEWLGSLKLPEFGLSLIQVRFHKGSRVGRLECTRVLCVHLSISNPLCLSLNPRHTGLDCSRQKEVCFLLFFLSGQSEAG